MCIANQQLVHLGLCPPPPRYNTSPLGKILKETLVIYMCVTNNLSLCLSDNTQTDRYYTHRHTQTHTHTETHTHRDTHTQRHTHRDTHRHTHTQTHTHTHTHTHKTHTHTHYTNICVYAHMYIIITYTLAVESCNIISSSLD